MSLKHPTLLEKIPNSHPIPAGGAEECFTKKSARKNLTKQTYIQLEISPDSNHKKQRPRRPAPTSMRHWDRGPVRFNI